MGSGETWGQTRGWRILAQMSRLDRDGFLAHDGDGSKMLRLSMYLASRPRLWPDSKPTNNTFVPARIPPVARLPVGLLDLLEIKTKDSPQR
jgi:hypothetical protein